MTTLISLFYVTMLLFISPGVGAQENPLEPILGQWQFYEYIYQGETHPLPNPQLILQFEFFPHGVNRLFWVRKNETGFCERQAYYSYENETITQEVFWTNPENHMECGQDTDMQIGHKNHTRLVRVNEDLHFYVEFSGEDFIYVLKRTH